MMSENSPPFPFGRALITKRALSANEISMRFTIKHPVFGEIYSYEGRFFLPDNV